jgi:DNA-binding NarL/FixJ family response regulator
MGQARANLDEQKMCAEQAQKVEKAKKLKPDLIILDLAMPRLNGAAAASVLKRTMPNVVYDV